MNALATGGFTDDQVMQCHQLITRMIDNLASDAAGSRATTGAGDGLKPFRNRIALWDGLRVTAASLIAHW